MDLGTNDSQHGDQQRTIHFPVELYERIMGNLNPRRPGDRNVLVNCCLTCKSWLPYARWCLYSLVIIAEFQKPSCLLLINSLRRSSFLANLVLRLESTFPPLKGDSTAGVYHTVLQQVATLMRRLQELTLRGLPQLHPSTIPLLSSLRFQTVTILKLVDTAFHSFQTFRQFISAFPQLDVLILKQVEWLSQYVGTSLRLSNPKKNTLALSAFELWVKSELIVDILTRWIFTTPSVVSLRRITISQYPDKSGHVDWHGCEPLLRGCRNVEILEIRNCRYPWSHELLSLSSDVVPSVRDITFHGVSEDSLSSLCAVLSRGISPKLTTIRVYILERSQPTSINWRLLDETLSLAILSHLQNVCIAYSFDKLPFRYFCAVLPSTAAKGLLKMLPWDRILNR